MAHTWKKDEVITAALLNDLEGRADKVAQPGPKGDKGATGATGPKGDKGDTGAAGKVEVTKAEFDALVTRVKKLEEK